MSTWWILGALLLGTAALLIVAHHPEPSPDEPDAAIKPRYRDLVRPAAVAITLILVALASSSIGILDAGLRPAWLVWASAGLVLVSVDARSTWLPIRVSLFTEVLLVAAVLIGAISTADGWLLARAGFGALAAGGLFWGLWRFSRGLGFGDVRLAAMVGGLTGAASAQWWSAGLLGGSIAALIWGLIITWWRRRHPNPLGKAFAYGPGLWLGPWLGWVWSAL